ncbi:MAG: dephospho-CoA kinase [Saprospiraceae bacterium]|nr:dephospho-CoA kinase [Saprospiraceae bacterium]
MLKVGITGGIGSGKTIVCQIFESIGIPVFYADTEAKKILSSDPAVKKKVKLLLGPKSYHTNGKPDRKFIAGIVFSDAEKLKKLNEIIHPAVGLQSSRWFEQLKDKVNYAIKEAALLVESGSYRELDILIVVSSPVETRIGRVMERDNITKEEVEKRIASQMPESQKNEYADFIILNDESKSLVYQVWAIHQQFLKRTKN